MRVFIVHAHPEPTSFNASMTREAHTALEKCGHEAIVSDLHAMDFDPISDRRNFTTVKDPGRFSQQAEEAYANDYNGFAPELEAEMAKLAWCDALVFQFPLYWLGMPAILKGWVDRVFAVGRTYGGGRYFGRGVFAGKRAMCALTVGGSEQAYSTRGIYGPVGPILFPINHGIFAFLGFTVVEPFVVFEPARLRAEDRAGELARYRDRILTLQSAPTIQGPDIADYDGLVLKATGAVRRVR